MAMQVRGIPDRTAFTASINSYRGLFYVEYGYGRTTNIFPPAKPQSSHTVLCLDVRLSNGDAVPFGKTINFRGDTEVLDYEGPLDLRLRVKGYAPRRSQGQAPSQVLVLGDRPRKLDTGPRVIRVRDEVDA